MANQQAKRDDNRIPALIAHDESTNETRRITCTSAGRLNVEANLEVGTLELGDVRLTDNTNTVGVTASNELQVLDSNSASILTAVQAVNTDTTAINALLTTIDASNTAIAASVAIYENAFYAETETIITKSEFTTAVLYGTDLDAGSPVLRAVQVAIDNATISATPNVLVVGGIYKNADDTYDDNDAVPFHFNVNGALKVSTEESQGTAPQAYGIDAAGVDTYTTVVTASAVRYHMSVSLQGANDAIVSIDSGTTNHFYIPANSAHVFDNVVVANGATVQGKNANAGNNYTNLAVTIW